MCRASHHVYGYRVQNRTAASSFSDTEALILALGDAMDSSQAAVAATMQTEVSAYVSSSATTKVTHTCCVTTAARLASWVGRGG